MSIPPLPIHQGSSVRDRLPQIVASSEFIAHALQRRPELWAELIAEDCLDHPRAPGAFLPVLQASLAQCADEASIMKGLRQWRQRELVRIACRDLAGASNVEETLRDLSAL